MFAKLTFFFDIFKDCNIDNLRPMNKAQKAFKNNKRLRVFLLFLSLAFVFWMLIKLSRTYTSTVKATLLYTDLPDNKMLQSAPDATVDVNLTGVGFSILKYKFSSNKVSVGLKKIKRKKGTIYYLLSDVLIKDVNKAFEEANVIEITPDTLYFDLGRSISKKVKVEPDVTIQYKSGFHLSGDLVIDPEYITVSGPKSQVDSIIFLETRNIELTNVYDSINKKVTIITNDGRFSNLTFSETEVSIKGKVEKFTEQTLEVPVKVINVPNGFKINLFPNIVKVVFQIGLSDFNKINENDFEVVCDYNLLIDENVDYLVPKVIYKSSLIETVKIIPNKVEFLLEK